MNERFADQFTECELNALRVAERESYEMWRGGAPTPAPSASGALPPQPRPDATNPLPANPGAQSAQPDQASGQPDPATPLWPAEKRFKLACLELRRSGKLDIPLPGQKKSETPIDWLVRHDLAPDPQTAAEMLLLAFGLRDYVDELTGSTFRPDPDSVDRLCKSVMRHTYK